MKIALVHDWLTGMRGGEKCLEVLCRNFPEAQVYTLLHIPGTTSPAIERMAIHTSFLQHAPGAKRHYRYFLPLMPAAIERLKLPGDVDLVVSFSHAVAKAVRAPRGRSTSAIASRRCVTHGIAAVTISRLPADCRRAAAAVREKILDWIQRWDRATSDRVTHFLAISRTVQRRIEESYSRPSRIIYPPVDTEFYRPDREGSSAREDYYLCVSALAPYKRIDLAVEACRRLGRRLVVIGAGPEWRRLKRLAGPTIELAGWCSDQTIRQNLRRCRAVLFPSNEDFGIVPLEAQACGTPVIAYRDGGATETIVEATALCPGTGWFFDRQTPDCLAARSRSLNGRAAGFALIGPGRRPSGFPP